LIFINADVERTLQQYCFPVSEGFVTLNCDVTIIWSKVALSREIAAIEGNICISIRSEYLGWICFVWVHSAATVVSPSRNQE